ncbi:MAG: TIGR00268 family protein, partial [Spirochaetaceae bacterium]|nr:TIGR00268 family protein [Spirochaetaceae bacterium]
MSVDEKYNKLIGFIGGVNSAAVAFSGGVDSSFLCYAARAALGERAIAVTIVSPMLPQSEIDGAKRTAALIGIRHILIGEEHIDEVVAANPRDRCYHCKKLEFGKILDAARENGTEAVFDGSNMDDLNDWRPGLRALAELKVCSPLREAGLTKE